MLKIIYRHYQVLLLNFIRAASTDENIFIGENIILLIVLNINLFYVHLRKIVII